MCMPDLLHRRCSVVHVSPPRLKRQSSQISFLYPPDLTRMFASTERISKTETAKINKTYTYTYLPMKNKRVPIAIGI